MSATSNKLPEFTGLGRRKTSVARVRLKKGSGVFKVNGCELEKYCYTENLAKAATAPLLTVEMQDQIDITVRVEGGGGTGQAGAIALGIARALQKMDPELRPPLKKAGHFTRDPRMKERKKAGQPGARKRFQFSKR